MAESSNVNVEVQQFVHGSVSANCSQTLAWIQERELKRDQIVSICMSETAIEDGESRIAVYYRTASLSPSAAPFDELQFREFTKTKSWEAQAKEAEDFVTGSVEVVALAHSAKNVMALKNQVVWFSHGEAQPYNFHYIKETSGDWDALVKKTFSYLNKYIAPHQLVHVSIFEQAHPNEPVDGETAIYCSIVHTAGASPVELRSLPNHNQPPQLYPKAVIKSSETSADEPAAACINKCGAENGHIVAEANRTLPNGDDDIIRVVISWQRLLQDNLQEQMRPTGCSCAIF